MDREQLDLVIARLEREIEGCGEKRKELGDDPDAIFFDGREEGLTDALRLLRGQLPV